jgi:ketosteroid isomerase-like protein
MIPALFGRIFFRSVLRSALRSVGPILGPTLVPITLAAACQSAGGSTAPTVPTAPAADRDIIAEVRAAAAEFDQAQLRADRATLERYLAEDFVFVRGAGKVADRQSFIQSFTTPGDTLEPFELVDRRLIPLGRDAVIASAEVTLKGMEGGQPFSEHIRFADVFLYREGRWQVVYIQVTPVR